MNCLEFKEKLHSAVEAHRPPAGDDLAAHSRQCPDCLREWNEYQLLTQAVAAWNDTAPAVDLSDSIVSRWLLETTGPVRFPSALSSDENVSPTSPEKAALAPESFLFQRRSAGRLRARQVFWIPGGLLLMFFLLIRQGGSPPENSFVSKNPPQIESETSRATAKPPLPELDTLLQDVESGYWELANSAVHTVSDAADLLPMRRVGMNGAPLGWPALMPSSPFSETTNPAPSKDDPSGPLSQGFSKALNLLLEVVPATELPTS
ncbi:MAG: hypothetical protein WD065_02690 [Planctomycetaceae bacterium]